VRASLTIAVFLAGLLLCQHSAGANPYPVTVDNCGTPVTFTGSPQHAVTQDIAMPELLVTLGLKDRMAGVSGLAWYKTSMTAEQKRMLAGLPEIAQKWPTPEVLLGAGADFYFAGWDYGFRIGSDLTPETLAKVGIKSYAIRESCAHVMKRAAVTIDDEFQDIHNIGLIFDVPDRAQHLIDSTQRQLKTVQDALAKRADDSKPRVFVYDSGEDAPFTSGRLAMPNALIEAAGGVNIMNDVEASWTKVGWEKVAQRNPDIIVIIDYDQPTAAGKEQWLETASPIKDIESVRNKRFVVLSYSEAVPSIHNGQAVEILAKAFHSGLQLDD
jgi:iron complex transport system substrate-binding protein